MKKKTTQNIEILEKLYYSGRVKAEYNSIVEMLEAYAKEHKIKELSKLKICFAMYKLTSQTVIYELQFEDITLDYFRIV